jgi:GNAT superfamily N-acetyltransferase
MEPPHHLGQQGAAPPAPIAIRPARDADLPRLQAQLPRFPGIHRDRVYRQLDGSSCYYIAWRNGDPVGHLFLMRRGTLYEPMASRLRGCPHISDVFVCEGLRSQGIGSLLLDAAEEDCRAARSSRVGLGVAHENVRARQLYERRGYAAAPIDDYVIEWIDLGAQGQQRLVREVCTYLVKPL